MKKIIVGIIRIYQKTLSSDHGWFRKPYGHCRFYPTCSEYATNAVEKYGARKGLYMATARLLRCHPWASPKVDEVK